jgi:hypothetical protein
LDLYTYSLALYGKTWYEKTFGAVQIPANERYDAAVASYMTERIKDTFPSFEHLRYYIGTYDNSFADNWIADHNDEITALFENAETFPEFFQALSKRIPKSDKCKFFKTWLEFFVYERIDSLRTRFILLRGRRHRRSKMRKTIRR